ncbi:MAG TPA: DUF6338 family protein [Longimicrobium sp.]|jgi:hypothetical protein
MKDLTPQSLVLFALFVLPGLTSMTVYRLIMPARSIDWAQSVLQGLFYSTANYVLLLPLVVYIHRDGYAGLHPLRYWAMVLLMVVVAPMCWPVLLVKAFESPRLSRRLPLPFPTVWDYVFHGPPPTFVVVRLKDGRFIGGYWGPGSKAGRHPNDGELYVSAAHEVDDAGQIGAEIPNTAGLHIRRDEYVYVRFFRSPVAATRRDEEPAHAEMAERPARDRTEAT